MEQGGRDRLGGRVEVGQAGGNSGTGGCSVYLPLQLYDLLAECFLERALVCRQHLSSSGKDSIPLA